VSKSERDEEEEPRKEPAKDYYAGYYFSGSNPYTSAEDLPGRKNDEELRDDVIQRLKRHHGSDLLEVDVHVVDSSVTLIGRVKTYKLKEEIGKKAWETKGVIKVLNEVEVTDAPTAGL
jgi:osmotically-inducible protein OsmY